jgi:hypothetical protein
MVSKNEGLREKRISRTIKSAATPLDEGERVLGHLFRCRWFLLDSEPHSKREQAGGEVDHVAARVQVEHGDDSRNVGKSEKRRQGIDEAESLRKRSGVLPTLHETQREAG